MRNKTCGECRHFRKEDFKEMCLWKDRQREACADFELPTNGDKIRQMTNSQLSKFLARISNCSVCFPGNPKGDRKWWYDWTFAPAEREEKDE